METMPEEMIFAASIVTLGSMLLFVFGIFYEINNSLSWPLIFMLIGGLLVIFSSFVRIFGALFRNALKCYKEKGSVGKIEKCAFYLFLSFGLLIFVISLCLMFLSNIICQAL